MRPARRQETRPLQGQATVAALRQLDPAGKAESFEELVARLLARLIQQPVRRARAGSQEGKDALSNDSAVAIECKRYAEGTSLTARHLISELEQAKARHPDLQLWILATTTALGATEKEDLDHAAHGKGLAVLHLDTAATAPYLEATYAIAALCATDIEAALEFLSGVAGRGAGRKLRAELEAIRSAPGFEAWEEWLREEVRNRLPIWRFVLSRQNLTLRKRISETAYTAFGTRYDTEQAVCRQARAQLNEWFHKALAVQSPEIPPVAVVVGERYDGKTWLAYQWLIEIAERSPVPIFLVGSGRGLQSDRGLTELQIEDIAPALKRERVYAESFVHNYRGQDVGKTPWALVVLDGLNEYAPNHGAWLRHLEAALGLGTFDCRPAAVLLTVRAHSWGELKDLLPGREISTDIARLPSERAPEVVTREIPLGPFTEEELQEALVRLRLPADLLETLPESARALAHRPRYLGLIAQHRRQLGDYAAVTPEVLHWLDLCDKVGHTRQGREDWGATQYQSFLRRLAKRWLDQRFLDEAGVRELLGNLTTQIPNVLAELRSEGVLSGESGNYTIQPDRLAMGYGLFLRDSLVQAFRQGSALQEVLRDLLAPLVEGDEAVDALRAASTLMLVEVAAKPSTPNRRESLEVLDTLLREWLSSRNLGRQDLEAIHELRRLLFDSLLRCWQKVWSQQERDSRMREIAVMVFGEEVEAHGPTRDRLRIAVREWLRFVPLEGGWHQRARTKSGLKVKEDDKAAAEAIASRLRSQVELPGLGHLALQITEGLDVTRLQAVSLYLVSRAPSLVEPEDLLAFLVVHVILEERIGSGDFWVVRRAAESIPVQWFEREVLRCTNEPNGILARALRGLIRIAARADLDTIKERLSASIEVEEWYDPSNPWPTKQNYRKLLQRSLKLPAEVERLAERARRLFCDPSLPQPPKEQARAFARALGKAISEKVRAGEMGSLKDFEEVIPAMAALAPDLGVKVIGQFLQSLPARTQKGKRNWLLELKGHAILARGQVRRALQEALRISRRRKRDEDWRAIQQEELALALLPAATLEETVTLLAAQDEDSNKEAFELAGTLRTTADRRTLVDALKVTRSPRQKRQLRFLLAEAGGYPLPMTEVNAICRTLRTGGALDIAAALDLAATSKVAGIDPELLFPISRGEVAAESFASRYASFLLVEQYDHEKIKDHLDDYWRAMSASRRPEDAQAFLNEISANLADKERRGEVAHYWDRYNFPSELAKYLDRERAAEWIKNFESWNNSGWRFGGGLIRPTFGWCLRNAAAEPAKILWPQVSPFQRHRFGGGSRLTIDGVDWVLHELNRPEADDDLSRSFLTKLILDARTDLEILEIALGARFRGGHRLRDLAQELSADPQAEKRARAVATLGWLVEGKERLETLRKSDPSLWVREQAEIALKRHALESWARGWFEQFLTVKTLTSRWAAGQLFLECVNRSIHAEAWKLFHKSRLQGKLKGEAILLLWAAQERAKKKADQLKSTLLGHQVNELSTVAHPWRRDDEWILAHYGRRD